MAKSHAKRFFRQTMFRKNKILDALNQRGANWREVCWSVLLEECVKDGFSDDLPDRAFAITSFKATAVGVGEAIRNSIDACLRDSADWPEYNATVKQYAAQDALLSSADLPQFAWEKASELLAADLPGEIAKIDELGVVEARVIATTHLVDIAMYQKLKNSGAILDGSDPDFWRSVIKSCGGARYFVTYAVAYRIFELFRVVGFMAQGRVAASALKDLSRYEFDSPLLKIPSRFWTPHTQPIVFALAYMPNEHRYALLNELRSKMEASLSTFVRGYKFCRTLSSESGLLTKQCAALRKQVKTAEARAAHLDASNRSLMEKLRLAGAKESSLSSTREHAREIDGYVSGLRERDARIESLHSDLSEKTEQLGFARELLTILLEPAPDTSPAPAPVRPGSTPENWRIVFVGGHERLHSKLRKHLRNAVFLHPDQSHFPTEVFDRADAVIFSVGYCNHPLTYRAANEVRRRGLRAGYSNFTNVEMVLDEVRSILFQGFSMAEQRAA